MACRGDGPVGKPGHDGDDKGLTESGPRPNGPIVRRFDPQAAATLKVIAGQLGIPVERFYGSPAGSRSEAAIGEATRREQERRLLSAFRRLSDPTLRRDLVDLADSLAPDA